MQDLKELVRDVPDFPKKGIIFKDITTLLKEGWALKKVIDIFVEYYQGKGIDRIVSMESRGFPLGAALAYKMGIGIALVRKAGKLPAETVKATYQLEYGTDSLELHRDSINPGMKVSLVDDLLATGGTAKAVIDLVKKLNGEIAGFGFLIELSFLSGREKLKGYDLFSIIKY
jgi:adenine phosphoribosyltransferase